LPALSPGEKREKGQQRTGKEKLPKNRTIFPQCFVVCIESQRKRLTLAADYGMVFTAK